MKTIFLDRDGVINRFPGVGHYVLSQKDFQFLPKAVEAIALLTKNGFAPIVISNQGCVAHGLVTSQDLWAMTERMKHAIEKAGGKIVEVYYCEHRESDHCECKKPKTGLFKKALERYPADLKATYFIGDTEMDIEAGKNIGCKTVLVLCGRSSVLDIENFKIKPDVIQEDLWSAVGWILESTNKKS